MKKLLLACTIATAMLIASSSAAYASHNYDDFGLQDPYSNKIWFESFVSGGWDLIQIGNPGDKVFIQNFNGQANCNLNSITTNCQLALKRGNTFYLIRQDPGSLVYYVYASFNHGIASDRAFAGDFDGDGRDEIGIQRGNRFYFSNVVNNVPQTAYAGFFYGNPGDIAFSGIDLNGDWKDDLVLQRGNYFYVAKINTSSASNIIGFALGNPGDRVVAGNFDNDNLINDLMLQRGDNYYVARAYGYDRKPWVYKTFTYSGTWYKNVFTRNYTP